MSPNCEQENNYDEIYQVSIIEPKDECIPSAQNNL